MTRKKQVLVFLFDDFADWETSYAMTCVRNSGQFIVKTIAMDKALKRSASGLSVLPDLDFIPEVDLKDLDSSNTALLILPCSAPWDERTKFKIDLLVRHCVNEGIVVAAAVEIEALISKNGSLNNKLLLADNESDPFDFTKVILEALRIDAAPLKQSYEGVMFG
jgi:hypothetical protein